LELQALGLLGSADLDHSVLGWGAEWVIAGGRIAAVGVVGALVLVWGWSNLKWASARSGAGLRSGSGGSVVLEPVYLQVHWAFYRAAPLVWLGPAGVAWAAFLGAAIVAFEMALDPRTWAAHRAPNDAVRPLLNGALCWLSALGFAAAQNGWLLLLMHILLAWLSAHRLGAVATTPGMGRRRGVRARLRLAQEEAENDQRAEDQARVNADALQVPDDVLVLLTRVGETRRTAPSGTDADDGRPGLSGNLRPLL
jgi:hypothetical protein